MLESQIDRDAVRLAQLLEWGRSVDAEFAAADTEYEKALDDFRNARSKLIDAERRRSEATKKLFAHHFPPERVSE